MSEKNNGAGSSVEQEVLFQHLARIGQALASPQRLKMLGLLCHGPRAVEELAERTGQSLALASAHLKPLRAACLVATEKRGRRVFCRVADASVERLWLALRESGVALLPEAREIAAQYLAERDALVAFTPRQLAAELKKGAVTLIDLRAPEEYAAGHLPGAINIPAAKIGGDTAGALPREGAVFAYCRGPYCVTAPAGVARLRGLQVPVRQLAFSVPEWRRAGLRVER